MSPPRVDDVDSAPTPRGSSRGRILLGLALLPIIYVLAAPLVLRSADILGRLSGSNIPGIVAITCYTPLLYLYFNVPLFREMFEAYASLFPKF